MTDSAHIVIVDKRCDYYRASPMKPLMVTIVLSSVDARYRCFKEKGVKTINEQHDVRNLHLRVYLLRNPESYTIEILKFL